MIDKEMGCCLTVKEFFLMHDILMCVQNICFPSGGEGNCSGTF